ncbi:MAG: hypothetical protein AAF628_00550 [Planctomycetota bacterium]
MISRRRRVVALAITLATAAVAATFLRPGRPAPSPATAAPACVPRAPSHADLARTASRPAAPTHVVAAAGPWAPTRRKVDSPGHPVGSVRAVVRHPQLLASEFSVELRPKRADIARIKLRPVPPGLTHGEHVFASDHVPTGTYSLRVQREESRGAGFPAGLVPHRRLVFVLGIENVQVIGGQRCPDPRLASIDVSDLCRRIVVQLRRPDGRPIGIFDYANVKVELRSPQGEVLDPPPRVRRSQLVIITGYPHLGLRLELERYRPVQLWGLTSDRTVTLQPR